MSVFNNQTALDIVSELNTVSVTIIVNLKCFFFHLKSILLQPESSCDPFLAFEPRNEVVSLSFHETVCHLVNTCKMFCFYGLFEGFLLHLESSSAKTATSILCKSCLGCVRFLFPCEIASCVRRTFDVFCVLFSGDYLVDRSFCQPLCLAQTRRTLIPLFTSHIISLVMSIQQPSKVALVLFPSRESFVKTTVGTDIEIAQEVSN